MPEAQASLRNERCPDGNKGRLVCVPPSFRRPESRPVLTRFRASWRLAVACLFIILWHSVRIRVALTCTGCSNADSAGAACGTVQAPKGRKRENPPLEIRRRALPRGCRLRRLRTGGHRRCRAARGEETHARARDGERAPEKLRTLLRREAGNEACCLPMLAERGQISRKSDGSAAEREPGGLLTAAQQKLIS